MSRTKRVLLVLLLLSLSLPLMVSAQATEEADPRAAVLQALANFAQNGGYHFTLDSSTLDTYTDPNKNSTTTAGIYAATGEVGAHGDYHDSFSLRVGATIKGAHSAAPFQIERVVVNGVSYINVSSDFLTYYRITAAAGWWRSSDLTQKLSNPAEKHITDATVETVATAETKTINHAAMNVYDLQINGVALLEVEPPGTTLNLLTAWIKAHNLLDSMQASASTEVWFGAQDGRLYGGTSQSQIMFPFQLASSTSDDLTITTSSSFLVSYPDQPIVISAPDAALLNP